MRELSLEERKKISLEILDYIKKVCDDNNLSYFLAYGTLIGCIRHQGFIPWDDDIDIWEPGESSGKFISINGDGYYFVKLINKNDTQVNFVSIRVPFTKLNSQFEQLREENKITEYITLPTLEQTSA